MANSTHFGYKYNRKIKEVATSYVVCVVSNLEFSKQYFSVNLALLEMPTVLFSMRSEITFMR